MTPLGFLVVLGYILLFVHEAVKNSGHGNPGNRTISNEEDVSKKRKNLSTDDLYGASTYDNPREYYADNKGRFDSFREACYYYDAGHDNARH